MDAITIIVARCIRCHFTYLYRSRSFGVVDFVGLFDVVHSCSLRIYLTFTHLPFTFGGARFIYVPAHVRVRLLRFTLFEYIPTPADFD